MRRAGARRRRAASGAIRIVWYPRTRALKLPFAVDVALPGSGANEFDEAITAEPVP